MNIDTYSPGLHKLVTLQINQQNDFLINCSKFIDFSEQLLKKYQLEKVGLVSHEFENKSFTVAICLKESHICIHTWPEYNQLTLDIYLCNYLQDNTEKVRKITIDYVNFFNSRIIKDFEINR